MLIPIAAGAIVSVVLMAGVLLFLRHRKKARARAAEIEMARSLPGQSPSKVLSAATMADRVEAQMAERDLLQEQADQAAIASIKVPPIKTKKSEVLVKQLKENAKKDISASVHVLQTWIHDRA